MRPIFRILTAIGSLLFSSLSHAAPGMVLSPEGGCSDADPQPCSMWLIGEIDHITPDRFDSALTQLRRTYQGLVYINLDSEGGDLLAAQRIGKRLRADPNHAAAVGIKSQCLSACVFVLAGAEQRLVDGPVGIHRPYYREIEALPKDARQKRFDALNRAGKEYLATMNIRTELIDEMTSVSPQHVKVLSPSELSRFGLNRIDPILEEEMADLTARRLGISRDTYLKRRARAERLCAGTRDEAPCMNREMSRD